MEDGDIEGLRAGSDIECRPATNGRKKLMCMHDSPKLKDTTTPAVSDSKVAKDPVGLLLLLRVRCRRDTCTRLQSMLMIVTSNHSAALFLRAHCTINDPFIFENLIESGALLGVDF